MAKYIDAEAVKAKKVYCEERHEYVIPVSEIDWMPAADVEPVRHGKWIYIQDEKSKFSEIYKCSQCGRRVAVFSEESVSEEFPYCHCGSKMDGGETNE